MGSQRRAIRREMRGILGVCRDKPAHKALTSSAWWLRSVFLLVKDGPKATEWDKVKLGKVQNEASYLSSRLGAFQKLWLLAFQTQPHLTWCREHLIGIQSRICDWISSMRLNFSCQRASAGENLNTLQHLGSYEPATALLCFDRCCCCCCQTFPLWDKSLMIGLKPKKKCETSCSYSRQ